MACDDAMRQIEMMYGPFDPDLVQFYKKRLSDGCTCTVNSFQRDLVFNLFFKYFGDKVLSPLVGIQGEISYLIAGNSRKRQSAAKIFYS